jgi:hypothetical protein
MTGIKGSNPHIAIVDEMHMGGMAIGKTKAMGHFDTCEVEARYVAQMSHYARALGMDHPLMAPVVPEPDPLADMGTLMRTVETAGPPVRPNRAQRRAAVRKRS